MPQLERRIDSDLVTLSSAKRAWASLGIPIKLAMLRTVKRNVYNLAAEWVDAAVRAKGLAPGSPLAGEEWISGPWAVMYAIARYVRTLEAIDAYGEPDLPRKRTHGNRDVYDVYPHDLYDRLLLTGVRAEVWMKQGAGAARFYRSHDRSGRLTAIMGAGNIASIAPLDVLYALIAHGSVCMLKTNPVNAYLRPFLERAFDPFVQAGFVRIAEGGAEAGAYLCAHPLVDAVHVTGSERTYETILREAAGKPVTGELGNVSPTIVIPGDWSGADIAYQAQHIATQKAHNAGFNCIAAQVLILPGDWKHSATLKHAIAQAFENSEPRPEYYPGAADRRERLAGAHSPLRTILDVDARDLNSPAFSDETFSGVLACVELPGETQDFLAGAVHFANVRLNGTLGANLIVKPQTIRAHRAAVEGAVEQLRYGCVGVNAWTGVGYFLTETPWGDYEGRTGVVHNAYLFDAPEKSVVYAPFRSFPKPPWFVTNRAADRIGRALCEFEMDRSPRTFARVAAAALRS